MNIIEKLGIKPIVSFKDDRGLYVCNQKPVRKVEQQNIELLEALIDIAGCHSGVDSMYEYAVDAIQAATDKTRQEVKDLLNA